KSGLSGAVEVQFAKDDWIFWPQTVTVTKDSPVANSMANVRGEGYFPLAVGNTWTYEQLWDGAEYREEITAMETIDGIDVYTHVTIHPISGSSDFQIWRDGDTYYSDQFMDDPSVFLEVPVRI